MKLFQRIIVFLGLISINMGLFAQCVQSVDFSTWTATGAYNSIWTVQSSNTELLSGANLNFPTMFMGPDTLINVKVTGTFRVEDFADDDYVGFVFGFQQTSGFSWGPAASSSMLHDYYLFDWKKNGQNYLGWVAQEGFSLVDVNGSYTLTNGSVFPSFWVHTNSANFNVLQTLYSTTNGWVTNVDYNFELLYTPTRAVIKIDNDTIFDQSGCFEPGLFGFYNYSQAQARYFNFNYELYVDYQIESQDVCFGDTARFNFIDTSGCAGANAFSNLSSFYWDLGDGTLSNDTNPSHVYATADTFLVSLIATDINGCTDTSSKYIYIHPPATAAFGSSVGCLGDPVALIDSSIVPMGFVESWEWDMGDGTGNDTVQNPNYIYAQSGTYTVQLIIETNAGCVDTVESQVEILDPPYVDFTFQNACEGNAVMLYNNSSPSTSPLVSFQWDVDTDGVAEYTLDTASHTFLTFGSYPIELKVFDQDGCRDSLEKIISVHPIPDADFNANGVCFGLETEFSDNSTVALGSVSEWEWNYGDGNFFNYAGSNPPLPGPTYEFQSPGPQNVQLTIVSDSGCVDSILKTIQVYHLPVANFKADTVCDNEISAFTQTSFNQSGNLILFNWQFGDGDSSLSANAQHNYPIAGEYKVTFTVESNFGCEDSVQKYVRVYPSPNTAFGWINNVCEGDELPFFDQSTILQATPGGDQITTWKWVFNSSDSVFTQDAVYQTTSAENINVKLTTWSNYGCTTFSTNTASIFPLPRADFSFTEACAGDTTLFKNTSKVVNGLIETTFWDFGNGDFSNDEHPGEVFLTTGNYLVTLSVASNKGCEDQIVKEIKIPETPLPDFSISPSEGCNPLKLFVENASSINSGVLTYEWYVDDSLVSNESSPSIIIHNDTLIPTFHTVAVIVESELGCTAKLTYEDQIAVLPSPNASFSIKDQRFTMLEPLVEFYNSSRNAVKWLWNFGDSATSDDFSPTHLYAKSGNYPVYQVAWNAFNCTDTAYSPSPFNAAGKNSKNRNWRLWIEPITTLYIPSAFTPNGDGINDTWFVSGFNEEKKFELEVFNRWGELVFSSNEMGAEWDGRMPNSSIYAPNTVYVYMIRYVTSDDEEKQISGSFSLVR